MIQEALQTKINSKEQCLHMAIELSHKEWKIAFGLTARNPRIIKMPARDLGRLDKEISKAKRRFGLSESAQVLSCFEAGRDGCWLHRYLVSQGIKNLVVDSSSIEVPKRKRRVKTDRVDVYKLLSMLLRWIGGERKHWSVVRVPSRKDEDERCCHREIYRLQKERNGHSNRITSLLITQGIVMKVDRKFPELLENVRLFDGSDLGLNLKEDLLRQYQRWLLADEQIREIRKQQRQIVKEAVEGSSDRISHNRKPKPKMVAALMLLCGVGEASAWPLVHEFFWRDFNNRRQVGSAAGLTGTPYDSGDSVKEQGISKAGNRRIRRLMVELSWFWLRYQPQSKITMWFEERFAHGGKRMRRIGIVAVARRLLITLWRYLEFGEVPEGARFKAAA